MNFLTDFWISLFEEILSEIEVDSVKFWEDMAYKNGPLVSPEIGREFMLPCYKKITDFFISKGIKNFLLDSDGDCRKFIPIWIEGGITGLCPNEVQANMDVVSLRKKFPALQLSGGIDKMCLIKGKESIDNELNTKIPYMLETGGYIPYVDHLVPPDVPWENYKYYRKKLEQLISF